MERDFKREEIVSLLKRCKVIKLLDQMVILWPFSSVLGQWCN